MSVRPAKTQISLGIRPVWSESSLCAQWIAKDPSFLHADSEDWIWVFAGRTVTLLVLSCHGSFWREYLSRVSVFRQKINWAMSWDYDTSVLRKRILETRMHSRCLTWAFAGCLCDKYYELAHYCSVVHLTSVLKFKWQRSILLFLHYSFKGIVSRIIVQKTACKNSN